MSKRGKDYGSKRSFEATSEPLPEIAGDVDPTSAPPGATFVIHQHHATRLHFDLRLEMKNGDVPVLVSWAVPKNLPRRKGKPHLAIHVEDHPFEYGAFSGTIPKGNYGAGEVRIFDSGTYELLERKRDKISFRLEGARLRASYTMVPSRRGGKDEWLVLLKEWEGPSEEDRPPAEPMIPSERKTIFDDEGWLFEPDLGGARVIAVCDEQTSIASQEGEDVTGTHPKLSKIHERLVALDAMVDGAIAALSGGPETFVASDLIYLDGRSLLSLPLEERRRLLEETLVPSDSVQISASVRSAGTSLMEAVVERGLSGVIAKKLGSRYAPGSRTRDWVRIEAPR